MIANDILVVADKPRIQHLLDDVEPGWGGNLITVSSLAAAEEHLGAGGTVGLLVIQDRLSGLSHELLIRHVRSLAGDSGMIIACAGDDPDIHDPLIHHLDLSLPDRDLVRQIERLIARLPRPDLSPFRELPPMAAPDPPSPPPVEGSGDTADPPADADTPGRQPVASRFEAELETELARLEDTPPPPPDEPVPTVDDLLRAPPSPEGKRRIPVIPPLLLLLLVVGGIWYLLSSRSPAPPHVAGDPSPSQPVQRRESTAAVHSRASSPRHPVPLSLPPFIARENPRHDPAFAASKPGWERYETASVEFRIYAPRGDVTALQVIARTPGGLSPALFSRALRELAGVRDYRTRERQVEGEYLVKRGGLGERGRVTIYKDRDDRRLHAFVIDLTEGGKRNP